MESSVFSWNWNTRSMFSSVLWRCNQFTCPPPKKKKEEPGELSLLLYPDNSNPITEHTDSVLLSLYDWSLPVIHDIITAINHTQDVLCFTWLITSCWQWRGCRWSIPRGYLSLKRNLCLCLGLGVKVTAVGTGLGTWLALRKSELRLVWAWADSQQKLSHLSLHEKRQNYVIVLKHTMYSRMIRKDQGLSLLAKPAPPFISMQRDTIVSPCGGKNVWRNNMNIHCSQQIKVRHKLEANSLN